MANFPALKCGAVTQYPTDRSRNFSTGVLLFVDGAEQRFPRYKSELKRWTIRLAVLDEGELQQVEQFFQEQVGRAGTFGFTDPWDSTAYLNCSFELDSCTGTYSDQSRNATEITILENR